MTFSWGRAWQWPWHHDPSPSPTRIHRDGRLGGPPAGDKSRPLQARRSPGDHRDWSVLQVEVATLTWTCPSLRITGSLSAAPAALAGLCPGLSPGAPSQAQAVRSGTVGINLSWGRVDSESALTRSFGTGTTATCPPARVSVSQRAVRRPRPGRDRLRVGQRRHWAFKLFFGISHNAGRCSLKLGD